MIFFFWNMKHGKMKHSLSTEVMEYEVRATLQLCFHNR